MKRLALFFSSLLALSATAATQDTLRVNSARMWAPAATFHAYQTDSLNMKGERFDASELLGKNPLLQGEADRTISYGEAMPTGDGTISQYAFNVRSTQYTKASIKVEGIKNYKLYGADNKELSGSSLTLKGEQQTVRLVALAEKEAADTFRVEVIGKGLTLDDSSPRPLTWTDMMTGPHHRGVSVSPTGRYAIVNYNNVKHDGKQDRWAVLSDLQTGRTLWRSEGESYFRWLEGADILYFTRSRDGNRQFVTLDPATFQESVLADNLPEGHYTLSPNRDYIICATSEEGRDTDGNLRYMEDPDDQQDGWRDRTQLWRVDLKNGLRQCLTFGHEDVHLNDISADGKKLLLSVNRFDTTRRPFSSTTLLEMDAFTGKVDTVLLNADFIGGAAQYMPDGHTLIMEGSANAFNNVASELKAGQIGNMYHSLVFLYDTLTRTATCPLPHGFTPSVARVTVCPGDNAVYLLADDGYDRSLFRLDATSKKLTRVEVPMSLIAGCSVASHQKNPRIIAYGQDGGTTPRLCYMGTAKGKFAPFGEIDAASIHKDAFTAPCHEWSFQSSRGDSIKCFYYEPINGTAGQHDSPMLVYYYGGCTATMRTAESNYPFQVWASQGYTVLVVEPSGANGFGQEFAARHVGTWGEGTAEDIIEATQQFCREHPWVNEKKVGCIGASYGGFMTEYLQTKTDIFAAAIAHAGISNITSYWGGGYWGYSYGEVAEYGQFPWSDRDLFIEHSPLFNADKIHTPLLLLHGTKDTNVPTTESQQLYTALRILGREVAYVTVNGENHVVSDPVKQTDWAHTILAWFAKYLKDQPEWWEKLYPAAKK